MNFKILYNKTKKWARSLAKEVRLFLTQQGHKIVKEKPDITIVIGGDGTLYYYKKEIEGKLLAIGSESSYVTQLTKHNWKSLIMNYIESKKTVKLPKLKLYKNNRIIGEAINDVVLHDTDNSTIKIALTFLDRYVFFEGDGVIVSTPLGSSGYSFSSGGPLIHLSTPALAITPISPVRKSAFPIVCPLTNIKLTYTDGNAVVVLDGQQKIKLKKEEQIIIKPQKEFIEYIVL